MRRRKAVQARTRTRRRALRYDALGEALGAAGREAMRRDPPLAPAEAEALRVYSIDYWRPRRPDEPSDGRDEALAFYDAWKAKRGTSIYDVASIIGADVVEHTTRQALRARIVVAARLRRLLAAHLAQWRRAVAEHIPGTSHTLAELIEQVKRAQERMPEARRRMDPPGPDAGGPSPVSLEDLIERHERWIRFLLEHSAVLVPLAVQEHKVRHTGTKAGDREWNRKAAALEDWMREHGGVDHADAVRFFEFCGFDLGANRMAHKKNRLREAARRHRERERAGVSRRRA